LQINKLEAEISVETEAKKKKSKLLADHLKELNMIYEQSEQSKHVSISQAAFCKANINFFLEKLQQGGN